MSNQRKIRIGIDVGGTFTHAVALHAGTLALLGKAKVPTTHTAAEGVARGVVDSLRRLLDTAGIRPEEVVLIAHSTTQATNALLEGDVAPVGIIGVGAGAGAALARRQTHIPPIPLAPNRCLQTCQRFLRGPQIREGAIRAALDQLRTAGAQVVVAAGAFSVDDPQLEMDICAAAAELGLPATATHHVSRLHGLGIRTRTAVINASMVPRMLSTADMTEQAIRATGISAPLMIMRSDGGVMDVAEMRRRPILTMLSGPAAGVAAALLYARVSDGLFLEVGGTSTDISVIKNGRCRIRSAEVGGQKLHVTTLDVRTVGLAGGSLVYMRDGRIAQVGPRSAHIAGLRYLSFAPPDAAGWQAGTYHADDEEYLTVTAGNDRFAVTPTCASNLLGLVPEGDCAHGRATAITDGFAALAAHLGRASGPALAEEILDRALPRVAALIEGFIRDYKLDAGVLRLIGGGGGAAAIVPALARRMNLPCELVENADVVSAIGVALALVRDTVERTVITPGEEDIRRIREEAFAGVLKMGAAAETIEVLVEVDARRNLLRATAQGSTEIVRQELRGRTLSDAERHRLVAASIGPSQAAPQRTASAAGFEVYAADRVIRRLWGLVRENRQAVRVLDRTGAIRWASNRAAARESTVAAAERDLAAFAETYTRYSDAGATIPRAYMLLADRIIDLSGLVEMSQVLEVLRMELARHAGDTPCLLLVDLEDGG